MNPQKPGIGWTNVWGRPGYSWNPIQGCFHGCGWTIGGQHVECYAKTLAERLKCNTFFPKGFEAAYFHETRLKEPLNVKEPSGIFIGSVADIMGAWVTDEQIQRILSVCREAEQHIFFLLTKNPARLRLFKHDIPKNVWLGVSMPPDYQNGKELTASQKACYMGRTTATLWLFKTEGYTTFMSFEPLSYDVTGFPYLAEALSWAIIGAASVGHKKVQPNPERLGNLLALLDAHNVPVYFKENLIWAVDRKEFPAHEKVHRL